MVREGLFANGPEDLVFKGGTAIRKFRLGPRGRFSTDLDFAVADDACAEHVIASLDQGLVSVEGVRFEATHVDFGAAKARWFGVVDGIGRTMEAKFEFTCRPTLLAPVMPASRPEISGITPDLLGFELPLVPPMRLEENLAEMGREVRDQIDLVRQIVCFKVCFDIVRDGRESPSPLLAGPECVGRTVLEIVDPTISA